MNWYYGGLVGKDLNVRAFGLDPDTTDPEQAPITDLTPSLDRSEGVCASTSFGQVEALRTHLVWFGGFVLFDQDGVSYCEFFAKSRNERLREGLPHTSREAPFSSVLRFFLSPSSLVCACDFFLKVFSRWMSWTGTLCTCPL